MNKTMNKKINGYYSINEDVAKILSYVASVCLFLVIVFTLIYIFLPEIGYNFKGIPGEFFGSKTINGLVLFTIKSTRNFFSYIFLTILGIISYIGALQFCEEYEEEIDKIKESEQDEPLKENIIEDVLEVRKTQEIMARKEETTV